VCSYHSLPHHTIDAADESEPPTVKVVDELTLDGMDERRRLYEIMQTLIRASTGDTGSVTGKRGGGAGGLAASHDRDMLMAGRRFSRIGRC
jgi:hypothetical protein